MCCGMDMGGGCWMLFAVVGMLLFWGVLIGLVVWGVKQFTGGREASRTSGDTPLEIAQKRLARGEITREEFDQMKNDLE